MSQINSIEIGKIMPEKEEKNMIGFFKEKRNRITTLVMALAVGILFSTIIVEYNFGINVFIFALIMTLCAGYVMYKDDNLNIPKFIFWSCVFLSIASVFFRLENITYTVFAVLLIPPLYVLMTIFSSMQLPQNIIVNAIIRFFGSIAFVDKIFIAAKSLSDGNDAGRKSQVLKILIGVGISLVLLLMIVPLMFSADAIFKKVVVDIVDLSNIAEFLWKSVLSVIIAILFFGFLYIITVKKDLPQMDAPKIKRVYYFGASLLTVLCIVGAVYTLFSVIQFNYLFGGSRNSLPAGYTVTEYARNGYFEQVALTVINLGIIAVSLFFTDNSEGKTKKAINVLLLYFIAVNLYLMVSSAYKMALYQDMYGFTVLRLLVDILLIFQLGIFGIMTAKIIKRSIPYIKYTIYFAAAFWAIVSFINIEGMCANININRYQEGKELDVEDLTHMNDVSTQLKYLYAVHYDELSEENITSIEEYFLNDAGNDYMYTSTYIINLDAPLEYNISASKRIKDANEVLDIINNR